MGLGRAHGAERGLGTARECGESGAEGAGVGKKKERRREKLTSGPGVLAEGDTRVARGAGLRHGVELGRSQPCWAGALVGPGRRKRGTGLGWAATGLDSRFNFTFPFSFLFQTPLKSI